MNSLYGRLFRYSSSERRTPLEDFLTEAFADYFNRISLIDRKSMIYDIFVPSQLQKKWSEISNDVKSLWIETQVSTNVGRVDLVVYLNDSAVVAIENKVGAPIGVDSNGSDQINRYASWIASQKGLLPPIVCLLSHTTSLPKENQTGRAVLHQVRWSLVAAKLRAQSVKKPEGGQSDLLAAELFKFLKERNMTTEYAGRDDFAAAFVYLRAGEKLDHTFRSIYDHLKGIDSLFSKERSTYEEPLQYGSQHSLMWGWKQIRHPALSGLFFAYGIALRPQETFRNAPVPADDAAFICVGAEDNKSIRAMRAAQSIPEKPWMVADVGDWMAVVSFRPLYEMLRQPEEFSRKMIEWISTEQRDIEEFVHKHLKVS